jgi:hypothetical protein
MLSWIVRDMIEAGDRSGVMLGFVRQIGNLLGEAQAKAAA